MQPARVIASPILVSLNTMKSHLDESRICMSIPKLVLDISPPLRQETEAEGNQHHLSPPRRSRRLPAKRKRRTSNPMVQAQNVMILKWGLNQQPNQDAMDDDAFKEYQTFFGRPLSASKREAIRTLLPIGAGLDNVMLIEGVEEELQ
jgi:hypothetical protein